MQAGWPLVCDLLLVAYFYLTLGMSHTGCMPQPSRLPQDGGHPIHGRAKGWCTCYAGFMFGSFNFSGLSFALIFIVFCLLS